MRDPASANLSSPIYSTLVQELHSPDTDPGVAERSGQVSARERSHVVFLHGLFGRGKNFARIASGLLPESRSLLVDLPNHGRSGWTKHCDYAQLADLVAEHLRRPETQDFAARPVDVVGHSMGGKVAMVLAARHPALVRRLAVLDISPVPTSGARSEFDHLLSALRSLNLATLTRRVDAHAQLRARIPDDTVRSFLLQNLLQGDDGSFTWQPNLRLLQEELDLVMGFPALTGVQFTGPVLWLTGGRSPYVTDDDVPAMRELFPRVHQATIPDAGHWVHAERPAEVIHALRAFLHSKDTTEPGGAPSAQPVRYDAYGMR